MNPKLEQYELNKLWWCSRSGYYEADYDPLLWCDACQLEKRHKIVGMKAAGYKSERTQKFNTAAYNIYYACVCGQQRQYGQAPPQDRPNVKLIGEEQYQEKGLNPNLANKDE